MVPLNNETESVVTWNCRQIANEPAIICTPDELMEPENEND
jgi:hypothetical protein